MKKAIYIIGIKLSLTAIAFYLISKRITVNPLQYFTHDSLPYFFLALCLSLGLVLLQALRWKHIASIFAIHFNYRHCLISVWAGHLINNVLPTATAGDLLRTYTLKRANHDNKWRWLGAFLAEKYSAATSALLVACATLFTGIAHELPFILILLVTGLFISLLTFPPFITIFFAKYHKESSRSFSTFYRLNKHLAHALLNKQGRLAFIDSTFINLGMCLIFYVIARGLDAPLTLSQCLFVVPVFTILASLPLSYAGWGIRELSCVELLTFFGISAESAVIISICYGLTLLLSCLPGIFVVYSFFANKQPLSHTAENQLTG